MTIIWHTKYINQQDYYKVIRRSVILNGYDGTHLSGQRAWKKFKEEVDLHVMPADRLEEYRHFFDHLDVEVSENIAWGVTGKGEIYMFVVDKWNPLGIYIRSNVMPLVHEILHAIYQWYAGTKHVRRKYDAPEGRFGTMGPASTVIVHDTWYGSKKTMKIWVRWGLGYLPIHFPYITFKEAKKLYNI